jgi:arylsulfatase A-like enzyme
VTVLGLRGLLTRPRAAACVAVGGLLAAACREAPPRPDVVLVVLDTVRRDRVQPCGCEQPTTPTLLELARRGTTWCAMTTPGTWTVPVHASIFTGRLPFEHGADFTDEGGGVSLMTLSVGRMREGFPTLAETFATAGYLTALASANPALDPSLGLARGFARVRVNRDIDAAGRPGIVRDILQPVLQPRGDRRPLFLVLNLSAAHSPYEAVPRGVDWLPQTPTVMLYSGRGGDRRQSIFARFVRGEMPPEERERTLARVRAGYDWGVRLADDQLAEALALLRAEGRLGAEDILVVTSDHGEMLGEEGLLDHGRTVAAANLDVFAVAVGPGFAAGARPDVPTQSQDLFPTLLQAAGVGVPALPDAVSLLRPRAARLSLTFSWPDASWMSLTDGRAGGDAIVSVQSGPRRAVYRDPGARLASEERLGAEWRPGAPDEALVAHARRLAPALRIARGPTALGDPQLRDALRALGYVQ